MIIGANPTDAHPVFASRMKKRLREGAKLIVIDPRRIDIVRIAACRGALHLPLMPGTNVAVLTALAHVIVTEGLVDEAFVRERCDWSEFEDWAAFVALPKNSPEATAIMTGVRPKMLRAAARLYATGGNGAIYYGLGVTEHSQGSTTVMAIANLAMATGNIGRPGVGVNPLRGQNNVQGSCDMGSFPHELPGLSPHLRRRGARPVRGDVGRQAQPRAGPAHPQHVRRRDRRHLQGPLCAGRGHPAVRSQHQACGGGARAMECVVVQDLFLNETANYAHVFLPGSTFLEKDGTFTNAERRIQRVRKVMTPSNGLADWEVTIGLAKAMGYEMHYDHPSEIMDEIARADADLRRRLLRQARRARLGAMALQREGAGRHADHAHRRLRARQGQVRRSPNMCRPTSAPDRASRCCSPRAASSSQYNVGAQTRRTENVGLA